MDFFRPPMVVTGLVVTTLLSSAQAQQPVQQQTTQQATARQQATQAGSQATGPQLPFPALNAQQQQELDQHLLQWQNRSRGTRTLETRYVRWRFDQKDAPAGIPAHRAEGQLKYATPDKGLFRDDSIVFYVGMEANKPQFKADPRKPGDYWVCNGKEIVRYDQAELKCTVMALPPEMQGVQIFNSPLPFVFNLNAAQIKERFWIRTLPAQQPNTYLIEAWPRKQNDRAQYKVVHVSLSSNYDVLGLVVYAPNYDVRTANNYDLYEFTKVKRNGITAGFMNGWLKNFIPQQPPKGWEVVHEKFLGPAQVAGQPPAQPPLR
ncbi:MAG: TIGR03009 domain-containing protein [Planctomycetota bacterium]